MFAYEQAMFTAISVLFSTSAVSAPANSTASAFAELEHRTQLEQVQQGELLALQMAAAQPQPPEVGMFVCVLQMAETDEEARGLACLQRTRYTQNVSMLTLELGHAHNVTTQYPASVGKWRKRAHATASARAWRLAHVTASVLSLLLP